MLIEDEMKIKHRKMSDAKKLSAKSQKSNEKQKDFKKKRVL